MNLLKDKLTPIIRKLMTHMVRVAIFSFALYLTNDKVAEGSIAWTGADGDGLFDTLGNWDPEPPSGFNAATGVNNVDITIDTTDTVTTTTRLDIGRTDNASMSMASGTLIVAGVYRIGVTGGVTGTVNHTGGTVNASGLFQLGTTNNANGFYTLDEGSVIATHMSLGGAAGTSGTMDQNGGTVTLDGTAGSFIGQSGSGTYNLSGGTLSRSTGGLAVGQAGTGILNQTGGSLSLGGNLALGAAAGGSGTYSISGGSVQANDFEIGLSGTGVLNLTGNTASMSFAALDAGDDATVNFVFSADGISSISLSGTAEVTEGATFSVDGSAYFAPEPTSFTLISAETFVGQPSISLVGFQQEASHDWNQATGEFTVMVIPEPALFTLIPALLAVYLVVKRRMRACTHQA